MRISSPPVPEIQAVDVREMAFALSLFQGALSQRLPTKNPSQRGVNIAEHPSARFLYEHMPAKVRDQFVLTGTTVSPIDNPLNRSVFAVLELRGESLRIRATAKPIITSTPKITSARFTGRDYVRASADLHNRAEICTGGRGFESPYSPTRRKKPRSSQAPNNFSWRRGFPLLILCIIRSAKIFTARVCYASHSFSTFHPRMVFSTLAVRGFFRPSARDLSHTSAKFFSK